MTRAAPGDRDAALREPKVASWAWLQSWAAAKGSAFSWAEMDEAAFGMGLEWVWGGPRETWGCVGPSSLVCRGGGRCEAYPADLWGRTGPSWEPRPGPWQ